MWEKRGGYPLFLPVEEGFLSRLIVQQEHHLKHGLFHVGFPGCEMVEQPQLLDTESMCCIEIIGLGLSA